MVHRIITGQGAQTLRHVPRVFQGRAVLLSELSTLVFTIEDMRESLTDADRTVATGTPTSDSTSTTTTAAAGKFQTDLTLIPVVSTVGFVKGRPYTISNVQHSELFTVRAIDAAGNKLYAASALNNNFTTAADVKGVQISASFPALTADDADKIDNSETGGPYQVSWAYVIDGLQYIVPEQILITRYSLQPWITADELKLADPTIGSRAVNGGSNVEQAVNLATQDFVAKLELTGVNPAQWRTTQAGMNAVRMRALEYVYRWFGTDRDDNLSQGFREDYMNAVTGVLAGNEPFGASRSRQRTDETHDGESSVYGKRWFNRA